GGALSYHAILCVLLVLVAAFLSAVMLKHNKPLVVFFIFLFALTFGLPQLVQMQSAASLKAALEASSQIPTGDLLTLAASKERVGDLSGAIFYVGKALKAAPDFDLQSQIDRQIKALRKKLADSVTDPSTGISER